MGVHNDIMRSYSVNKVGIRRYFPIKEVEKAAVDGAIGAARGGDDGREDRRK